jgi:hypothetical protein
MVKFGLKSWNRSIGPFETYLLKVMKNHRSAAGTLDCSPAERLLGYKIKADFPGPFAMAEDLTCNNHIMTRPAKCIAQTE